MTQEMDALAQPTTTADEHAQLPSAAYAAYLTPVSKEKGDAGIYAAMDAMQLSRALHGATTGRLDLSTFYQTRNAAGGGVAGARAAAAAAAASTLNGSSNNSNNNNNNNTGSNGASHNTVQLGMEPEVFRHGAGAAVHAIVSAALVDAVQDSSSAATRAALQRGMEGGLSGTSSTAVGLPESVAALRQVLPLVQELKPRDALNYDGVQRLFALMEEAAMTPPGPHAAAALTNELDDEFEGHDSHAVGVTTLLLSKGLVNPAKQPAPSTAAWEAAYNALQARYPLPPAPSDSDDMHDDELEDEDGGEEGDSSLDRQHNAALQERCAALHLSYTTYKQALRDVAAYEMRVFPLLCEYLSHNEACRERGAPPPAPASADHGVVRHRACANVKVLNLASNGLGAPCAPPGEGDDASGGSGALVRPLAPLRALAAMLDANESLRYLNLRDNALGPRGVGILAKALTKNIALTGIDLSANALNGAPAADAEGGEVEEVEDPLYEEEDPVFGETLEGLEALAELLKKNKFLRVLRLGENGLHPGEDLTGVPPPEEEEEEEEPNNNNDDSEAASHDGVSRSAGVRKGLTMAEAQERWQGIPLWNFLTPLHRYHRLRVLDLSKNFLGNTGAQMVAVAVSHNHSIEVLDLTNNAIGYSGLNHLARYLFAGPPPHGTALHTLILRQNPLGCVGGAADAATGVDARRRRLTKKQQKKATAAVENFAAGLRRHGRLRRLLLANTYLGPAASAVVLRALAAVPTLTELDFSFNHACGTHTATFDATALPCIAALLYPALTSPVASPTAQPASAAVAVSGSRAGVAHDGGAAPPTPKLERLCLDGNNLTAAGLAALVSADADVLFSPNLRELTLSRNSLGDALGPLAALLQSSSLARLDLSYNDISTMAAVAAELPSAVTLEDLNLSHNKLGVQEGLLRELSASEQEAEVTDFFHALAQMPSLAVLDLSYNDWHATHVEQLATLLADPGMAAHLRKLDLRHTPHVPAGPLMAVLQHLAARPGMEVFAASVTLDAPPAEDAHDATTTDADGTVWTFEATVAAIHAWVSASDSLVDVDCGLRPGDAVEVDSAASQATEDQIEQIRERLLLNALMAASSRSL